MKNVKRNVSLQKLRDKKILMLVIVLLIIAPVIINIGLIFTDFVYNKMGMTLTANNLNNANWLEFWKDYISVAIAFLGIYLVWDSANKDRKIQSYRESAEQYLEEVRAEEKVLVEVSQCFNMGIIYKALGYLKDTSVQDSKVILQEARDRVDEVHVKFELLTDLSDDFERCNYCMYNPCVDKRIKMELRDMFYDMEKHYIEMLNVGDDCVNGIIEDQNNFRQTGMLNQEILKQRIEPIQKEVDYLSKTMRPKFNRYCKWYIDLRKKHASELKNEGIVTYVKEDTTEK